MEKEHEAAAVRDQAGDWMRELSASGVSHHAIATGVMVGLVDMLLGTIGKAATVDWLHLQIGHVEATGDAWEKAVRDA